MNQGRVLGKFWRIKGITHIFMAYPLVELWNKCALFFKMVSPTIDTSAIFPSSDLNRSDPTEHNGLTA